MDYETAQRIERLEQQVALLYRHLGLNGQEDYLPPSPLLPPPSGPGEPQDYVPGSPRSMSSADPGLPAAFYAAMANNRKIQAIKIYREVTGVGLKEAKDYVDSLGTANRRR